MYTIQYDEPVAVKEHFMKDIEVSASLKQFHGGDDDDSSSAGSVPMEHEHLSEFEFSDSESNAEPGNNRVFFRGGGGISLPLRILCPPLGKW